MKQSSKKNIFYFMKAKLVSESLFEYTSQKPINEKLFKGDGPLATVIINFLMATVGTMGSAFMYKHTGDIAWGIMAPVLFGVGGFGILGSIADLDYFEWINDLEDWVKSRKYSTKGGKHEVEEKIEKVKTAVLNSPQLSRGKKANITRIQNNIKRAIEKKD